MTFHCNFSIYSMFLKEGWNKTQNGDESKHFRAATWKPMEGHDKDGI
jgi:hypothetical protein